MTTPDRKALHFAPRARTFGNRLRRNLGRNWELCLFCIPGLALLFIFYYVPMYDGILMSFKDYKPRLGVGGSPWIGMKNFILFFSSYNFRIYLFNTLRLSFYSLVAGFPLPIVFAVMVNELMHRWFKKTVQMISYAPNFISTVVIVGMMNLFFANNGLVNTILQNLGLGTHQFGIKSVEFVHMYVWSGIWQSLGFSTIVYIAALSNVDVQQIEAARIDGATKLQRIWHIELPVLLPTATILLLFALGSLMGSGVEKILLMQTPLNLDYSEVIATYVYKVGLLNSKYSFSAAVGLFNSIANFILLTAVNFVAKRVGETSLW